MVSIIFKKLFEVWRGFLAVYSRPWQNMTRSLVSSSKGYSNCKKHLRLEIIWHYQTVWKLV